MINLIFLHGLLGSRADWKNTIENLPHFRCIALDLPCHGSQRQHAVTGFEEATQMIHRQIRRHIGDAPYFLIGYSLGGRLALYYALQTDIDRRPLQAVILEGANLGLPTEAERAARRRHDQHWAARFRHEPPESVLADWYRQPVFAHLSNAQRLELITKRRPHCGSHIADMLLATGLAEQPDFSDKVRSNCDKFFYLHGERDQKFADIAQRHALHRRAIPHAGHNAHLENPTAFAQAVTDIVQQYTAKNPPKP